MNVHMAISNSEWKSNPHRLLVPGPVDVEADAMDDEGDVDDDEEVVRVPEHVEAAEAAQRVALAELSPAEPRVRQRVGDGHEHDHDDAGDALDAPDEPPVVRDPALAEVGLHGLVRGGAGVQQPREVAREVRHSVQRDADGDAPGHHLVEVDVVVERDGGAESCPGPEPGDGVPADGEQDERHVELGGLGAALGDADAVAHHVERRVAAVRGELPGEERRVDGQPQRHHPHALPVVLHEVEECHGGAAERAVVARRRQPLADQLADVVGAVRHQPRRRRRRRRLQQQRLQVRELFRLFVCLCSDVNVRRR